jgi:hypothetical protein
VFAVAVSVTAVPLAKLAAHVVPHVMPAGELLTDPVPVPANTTVSWNVAGAEVANVAVTEAFAVGVTLHVPVPVHAPNQPVNVEPVAGVAVSVMAVPLAKLAEQVVPQVMPAGELLTDPVPVPASTTLS